MPGAEGSGEIPQTPPQKDKKPPVVKATDTQEKKPTLENRKEISKPLVKDVNPVKESEADETQRYCEDGLEGTPDDYRKKVIEMRKKEIEDSGKSFKEFIADKIKYQESLRKGQKIIKNLPPDVRKTLDKLRPEDINVVKEVIPRSEIPQEMKKEYIEWQFRKGEFFSNLTDGTKEFIRNVIKNKDSNELKRMKNIYIDKYNIDSTLINDAFDNLTEKSLESKKGQRGTEERFLEYKIQQIASKIEQNSSEQKKSN
jgi:hypothetical protein